MAAERRSHRLLVRAVALVVLVGGALAGPAAAGAQSLTLPTAAPAAIAGLQQNGAFTTAPIVLDGITLFRVAIATPAGTNGAAIGTRVNDIQTSLGALVASVGGGRATTVYEPASIRVHIVHNGLIDALEAVDARHTDPFPIVTVTAADAQVNQTTIDGLATEWQSTLQNALIRALDLRQPAAQKRAFILAGEVALGLVALTLLALFGRSLIARRIADLARAVAENERAAASAEPEAAASPESGKPDDAAHRRRRRFLALSIKAVKPEQRLIRDRAVAESILWALVLAWAAAIVWTLTLFPDTTPVAQALTNGALGVLTTIVVFGLVNRVLDALIARGAAAWRSSHFANSEDHARQLLRVPTVSRALSGFKTFILAFVTVLAVLSEVGVPIGSVVTIGGVAAIALSLAAQNFVRDFVNGFLVLFEDHYVVGDYVTINGYSGLVETLTLRMVQIRDVSGDLITVPHSAITGVANQSRNWSRVDFRVPVDPAADVDRAIELVRSEIEALARDEAWRDAFIEPIEWIGIDALSKDWAIVRAVVRTAPLRQFALKRAINARVRSAFVEAHILFGAQIPGVS